MATEEPTDRPISHSVYQALHDALELSDFNIRTIVEGPGPANLEDYAALVGRLMKEIQQQLVIVAMHLDDLVAEVRAMKDE
jgi:hypothetical protein